MKRVSLKKVADLDKVVQLCGALGPNYTPGNEALMPTVLASLLTEANEKMKAVNNAQVAAAMLGKERRVSFKGIPSLAAKIVRRVLSSQSTFSEQLQAQEIKRRYFQHGALLKIKAIETMPEGSEPPLKYARTNFRDYAGQLAGLEQLVHLVSTIPGYTSVEPALTVEGLNQTLAGLQAMHVATISARLALTEARKARNEMLVKPGGVVASVDAFKNYLRSKYGFGDPTVRQL